MDEEKTDLNEVTAVDGGTAVEDSTAVGESTLAGLDQPEDEATEHALRLMDEALRRNEVGRRWLVAGDP